MAKAAHHSGPYRATSRQVTQAANNNPHTLCWRCGLTLPRHPLHANGNPPKWTAGHTIDGSTTYQPWLDTTTPPPPGDWLAPEASTCNYSHGTHSPPHTTIITTHNW